MWRRVLRAQQRYTRAQGDFYAAGITYFTIFALFPLLMIGFAVVGFVLTSRPQLLAEIDARVKSAVPGDLGPQLIALIESAIDSRTSVGIIGLATAIYVGLLWMQRLREALTQMWGQPGATTGFVKTKLSDLRALAVAFAGSLLTIGLTALAEPMLIVPSVGVSWLLFTVMIARLPRHSVPFHRCAAAGLLAAVGFEIFKQVASIYLRVVLHGPAGTVFGPVLGVMVFAYMTARLMLFATAWAATEISVPAPVDSASAQTRSD
ncbi:YhjD/YihY/BrkB family envelope integrity protein [Mycolicibacterium sp.]|uniref:YhjD/YihY/BrkB family envelope integrity protein n=1 Tax=Mycolicibacterium sp. TaxID=2320850 RepID=UPI0025FC221D|nr:YhjD/YihY/BrkB family envelope integrity protein [Mycolicibacterium sp.]